MAAPFSLLHNDLLFTTPSTAISVAIVFLVSVIASPVSISVTVLFAGLVVSVALSLAAMFVFVPLTGFIVSVAIPFSIPMLMVGGPAVDDHRRVRAILPLVFRSMKSAIHIAAVHGKMRVHDPCGA